MPIKPWFPTFIHESTLQPARKAAALNRELLSEAHKLRRHDVAGQRWSKTHYAGGYTSFASMCRLHTFSSTFMDLESKIRRQVNAFARHLDMDLQGRALTMTDCWVNVMPKQTVHGLHLHPL